MQGNCIRFISEIKVMHTLYICICANDCMYICVFMQKSYTSVFLGAVFSYHEDSIEMCSLVLLAV